MRGASLSLAGAVVGAIAATIVGHAEPAGTYRAPAVGTEFLISDTAWFRVVGTADDAVTTENASWDRTTWVGGLVTLRMSTEDRARLRGFFPLTAGARLEYGAASAPAGRQRALAVVADDVIQVEGRAIPVIRVTRHQVDGGPRAAEGEYTLWFAPEYGFPLKMTYRHIAGEAPRFTDWQIVRIVPPPGIHGVQAGSLDGVWRLSVSCTTGAWYRRDRAIVKDGIVMPSGDAQVTTTSGTHSDLTLSRSGDEIELKGSVVNAGGQAVVISARGTLVGQSASGSGTINARSGCAFSADRL